MIERNHKCYVSLEVAKLLKEAGFDWELNSRWQDWGGKNPHEFILKTNLLYADGPAEYDGFHALPAPTLEVAQRWLREVKNTDVVVSRAMQWKQFYYTIEHEENRTSKVDFMSLNEDLWWFKYEESQEAGIKKALEMILEEGK